MTRNDFCAHHSISQYLKIYISSVVPEEWEDYSECFIGTKQGLKFDMIISIYGLSKC
jgi:hypothetical protein